MKLGFEEACLDMGPYESPVNSIDHLHMGRSEALFSIVMHWKVFLEEPTENTGCSTSRRLLSSRRQVEQKAERFCSVEYKYNRQGTALSV